MARLPWVGLGGGSSGGNSGSSNRNRDRDRDRDRDQDRGSGGGSSRGQGNDWSLGGGDGDDGGGGSGGGGGSRDRLRETVERFKREVHEQTATPGGIDAGEPITGVDGPGDPRTSPNDPKSVEGPSRDGSSVDGLGGENQVGDRAFPSDRITDPVSEDGGGGGLEDQARGSDGRRELSGEPVDESDLFGGMADEGTTSTEYFARQRAAEELGVDAEEVTFRQRDGDIFATTTGGQGSTSVVEQARDLEQQFLDETPLNDPDQVRIVREGDTLRTEVTDVGREFLEDARTRPMEGGDVRLAMESAQARGVEGGDVRLAMESAQAQQEEEFGDRVGMHLGEFFGSDVRIDESGDVRVTPDRITGDQDIAAELTQSGGLLSERQERQIRQFSQDYQAEKNQFIENLNGRSSGESTAINAVEQGAKGVGNLFDLGAYVTLAETGIEVAGNTPRVAREEGVADTAATGVAVGRGLFQSSVSSAAGDPAKFLGELVGGLGAGAVAGKAAGVVGRRATDRVRTLGGDRIDLDELTNEGTVDYYRGGNTDPENRFPGAQDPDAYRSDPAGAVEEQAQDFTPDRVNQIFESAGVSDGVVLKKALDTEPDGPGTGGFRTQEGSFESPGAFVGPELSPNFLRTSGRSKFSFRPGLPTLTSSRPTGVLAKTDVRNSNAADLEGFNREVLGSAGDTTAITKPRGSRNPGEIEAVIPPESSFVEVTNRGLIAGAARQVGIGSDFFTEVGGRRVPLRTVASEGPRAPDVDTDVGQGTAVTGQFDDFYRGPGEVVDRPIPLAPPSSGAPSVDVGVDGSFYSGGNGSSSPAGSGTLSGGSVPGIPGSGGSGSPASPLVDLGPPNSPPGSSPPGGSGSPPIGLPPSPPLSPPSSDSPGSPGSSPSGPGSSGSPGAPDPIVPFVSPPSSSRRDEDFGIDFNVDDQTSGFLATATEQEFINRIGTVSDIVGI